MQPWTQPWWRPTPGDGPTFFWMVLIHVGALAALILAPLPGWRVLLAAAALHFLGGLGTTVCFHRALAHKSVKLHPAVRNVLTFFAMLNGSGSPLSWAAYHRLHHAKSDTPEDISSPRVGGFWWSHLRWLWQAGAAPISKYCRDIDTPGVSDLDARADPDGARWRSASALPFGLAAFFWLGPMRLALRAARAVLRQQRLPHAQGRGPRRGDREERPLAVADALLPGRELAPEPPRPPRLGAPRLDAAQLDVGWYTILLLEKMGLATDVRRPDLQPLARRRRVRDSDAPLSRFARTALVNRRMRRPSLRPSGAGCSDCGGDAAALRS